MKLLLNRNIKQDKQTLGTLQVFDGQVQVFRCFTLELPWKNNEKKVSCIPVGEYKVVHRHSKKYGNHLHIKDVEGRDAILIHFGNYLTDILGCVLVGDSYKDINGDKLHDVTNSKATLKKLVEVLKDAVDIELEVK